MARHMFFGGNTPGGFYSVFSDILFLDEAQKIIYLKGSSGSGKSTFMKKAGEVFERKGIQIDYIHCANSTADLDGICAREVGISIVDGTSPHICDPVLPVAIDEIFNLAVYIDREYVSKKSGDLLALQSCKKQYYDKAYNYLNAAYKVYGNNSYIYSQALSKSKLHKAIVKEASIFKNMEITEKPGRNRRFFAAAVTPQGYINYIDTLIEGKTVVALYGEKASGMDLMLETLKNMANLRGLYTESCCCALNPDQLEHLIIPSLNLCFTTMNGYDGKNIPSDAKIDFHEFMDMDFIDRHEQEIHYNSAIFNELLQKAMDMMAAQKEVHDRIEEIYVAGMDFDGLNIACEEMISRLLALMPAGLKL